MRQWQLAIIFLAATALYVPRRTVSLQQGDASEYAAVIPNLAVAHPPGAIPFMLLGRMACFLPLDDYPARLALLSSLCMAGAVTLAAAVALELAGGLSGAAAAVILTLAPHAWQQALRIELYPAAALINAIILYCLIKVSVDPRQLYLAIYISMFAALLHPLLALTSLVPCAMLLLSRRGPNRCLFPVLTAAALVILSAGIYLPLRAGPGAPFPASSTPTGLLEYLTAYHAHLGFHLVDNLAPTAIAILLDLPLATACLAATGFIAIRRRRQGVVFSYCLFGGFLPFALYAIPDIQDYLVVLLVPLGTLAGIGLESIRRAAEPILQCLDRPVRSILWLMGIAIIVIPSLIMDAELNAPPELLLDRSRDVRQSRLGRTMLHHLLSDTKIISDWLDGTPLFYLLNMEKAGPAGVVLRLTTSGSRQAAGGILNDTDSGQRIACTGRWVEAGRPLELDRTTLLYMPVPAGTPQAARQCIETAERGMYFTDMELHAPAGIQVDTFLFIKVRWVKKPPESDYFETALVDRKGRMLARTGFRPARIVPDAEEWYPLYVPFLARGELFVTAVLSDRTSGSVLQSSGIAVQFDRALPPAPPGP
ncbi:DUF2723 domain-containing protein [bacterium]|nr:DUF2723 domain-containing protein [candidate division CSSED10-310 bacterium]